MARDFWLTRRHTPTVDKIRQTITLPAVTADCFRDRASVYNNGSGTGKLVSNASVNTVTTVFTLEFAFKVSSRPPATNNDVFLLLSANPADYVSVQVIGTDCHVACVLSGLNDVAFPIAFNEWQFLSIVVDAATTNLLSVYLNGAFVGSMAAVGVPAAAFDRWTVGGPTGSESFLGSIAELKLWDTLRTDYIPSDYNRPKGTITVEPNLIGYVPMNEGSGASVTAQNGDWTSLLLGPIAWSTDYPPLIYGASFVLAEWPITLPNHVSLVWPKNPDAGTTGMLVVRWVDSDGEVRRCRLWDLDGVDIAPNPPRYAGENVTNDFCFELYNVDGAESVVLPAALTISISSTTMPTNSSDRAQQGAATGVTDQALGAVYPLVFPITFDQPLTF